MKKKKRQLSAEDRALWLRLKATVTPLPSHQPKSLATDEPISAEIPPRSSEQNFTPPALTEGARLQTNVKASSALPLSNTDGLMKKRRRDVKKGRIDPKDKLDLHGLRLEAAEAAFSRFIQSSAANGYDVVLVVTGKGGYRRYDDLGFAVSGVIRRALPIWVHKREISALVSHYIPAHIQHGGEGAWYIFIRSKARRKFGP